MYIRMAGGFGLDLDQAPPAPAVSVRTPNLLWSENQSSGLTLYVDINLKIGAGVAPLTGIFLPYGYRRQSVIDLVVYLHGHNDLAQCFEFSGVVPIDKYWKRRPFWLREEVNHSGKNVILVAPSLGQRSQAGDLVGKNGFDNYLDQVLAALIAYGPYKNTKTTDPRPTLGRVIMACHSGGGKPMLEIAQSSNRTVANIQEYWGFDCLYSGKTPTGTKLFTQPNLWIKWAKSNKNQWLFIYYKNNTKVEAERLQGDAIKQNHFNVLVNESQGGGHCLVPITHFRELLRRASFLSNR